jgi:hypothetical protein
MPLLVYENALPPWALLACLFTVWWAFSGLTPMKKRASHFDKAQRVASNAAKRVLGFFSSYRDCC